MSKKPSYCLHYVKIPVRKLELKTQTLLKSYMYNNTIWMEIEGCRGVTVRLVINLVRVNAFLLHQRFPIKDGRTGDSNHSSTPEDQSCRSISCRKYLWRWRSFWHSAFSWQFSIPLMQEVPGEEDRLADMDQDRDLERIVPESSFDLMPIVESIVRRFEK